MTKIELFIEDTVVANDAFLTAYNSMLTVRKYLITGSYGLLPAELSKTLTEKYGPVDVASKDWEDYIDNQIFLLAAICQQVQNQLNKEEKPENESDQSN